MMSKEVIAIVAAILTPTVHEDLESDDMLDSIEEAVLFAIDLCESVETEMEDGRDREPDKDAPRHRKART